MLELDDLARGFTFINVVGKTFGYGHGYQLWNHGAVNLGWDGVRYSFVKNGNTPHVGL